MTYSLPPRAPELVPDFVRALPKDGRGRLALFDADGTLWRDDVADDFCCWMLKEGHIKTQALWPEYLRIYREDHEKGCQFMLRFYEGMPIDRFHELCDYWWSHIKRRWVIEVLESIYLLADEGYSNWVVTGSPTDTMNPLVNFLPVHRIVGMDFELENNVITGRHTGISCADEGKARKIRSLWSGPIELAAGNGSLDAAMIELSHSVRWSVYPNPAFRVLSLSKGWHILDRPADFIEEMKLA